MRRVLLEAWLVTIAIALAFGFAGVASAEASSTSNCAAMADEDYTHPGAPGTYTSYHCHGLGGEYVTIHGRGGSGTYHEVKLRHWHANCWIFWCDQHTSVYHHLHKSSPFH